ncbi:MAG: hypothetical protein WHS83_16090, partial [Chloroflexus sp.]|uniref:hypothetical protein n=1 Tax=Chloroflexus sp. TaxID=1904827 RepID=UPI0030A7CAE1
CLLPPAAQAVTRQPCVTIRLTKTHVILMSGYLQRVMANGSEPPYPVLNKPFTRHQLFALIRQTISQVG